MAFTLLSLLTVLLVHPGTAASPAAGPAARQAGKYVCLVDPQIGAEAPGLCPICGFALVAKEKVGNVAFSCATHPEVQQSLPGTCPKCGRNLLMADLQRRISETYVCPMHPGVTSPLPGKCDRCGMALVSEEESRKKSAAYRCPMDPDAVSDKPGKCARCGMNLQPVDVSELVSFPTELAASPAAFKAGQRVRLRYTVKNPVTGGRVRDFDVVHEKRFHLFVVSQDFEHFDHIHPEQDADGGYFIDVTFPRPGYYRLYADFFPTGGTPQLVQKHLVTADCTADLASSQAQLRAETSPKDVDGTRVTLKSRPETFVAGEETTITYEVSDTATGRPVRDIQPYLGAWGHTFIVNEDGSETIHSHPADEVDAGDPGPSPPEVSFKALFPKPGPYRIWTQFQRRGRVATFVFTVEARRLK